jgi:hypothetical protein
MIWQMASGMSFTQSGGYIGFLPPAERAWRILQNFYAGVGGLTFENDISAFCVTHQVSAILVGPGTPPPLAAAVDALHWPEKDDHGVRTVHVPDPRVLHFYYISGDYWPAGRPGELDGSADQSRDGRPAHAAADDWSHAATGSWSGRNQCR